MAKPETIDLFLPNIKNNFCTRREYGDYTSKANMGISNTALRRTLCHEFPNVDISDLKLNRNRSPSVTMKVHFPQFPDQKEYIIAKDETLKKIIEVVEDADNTLYCCPIVSFEVTRRRTTEELEQLEIELAERAKEKEKQKVENEKRKRKRDEDFACLKTSILSNTQPYESPL